MLNSVQSLFNPLRINIPFLLDIIIVSDSNQIKQIENSGDVDRLHSYETQSLPLWVQLYFRSTKFHDDERDLWFCPFESSSNPTYLPRRAYLEEKTATGYSQDDVRKIAQLLRTNASDEILAHEMVQVVNKRFFEAEIPTEITEAAKYTVQKFSEAVFPWQYIKGVESQKEIMNYCQHSLAQDVHLLDVGHNIGEVVQATAGSLKTLNNNLNRSVEDIFTEYAPTPQVPRIAVRASTFDGMLSYPTIPGETVVILQIAKAAAETKDIWFTFGTGTSERGCVFKDFFLNFMNDLQQELQVEE
ncbi:conserved hypothetical protein [Hyella patelloides LEGE 07179]|uniref:Uncharacterized protein n=1 Tax=Hyella patelloides LEGE 07179 TaxID=945734 RepID=A0A563VLE1_9CYAN|nr:hypothetical protein [Hyella patelloides]VEP12153.1 conserved hypothetical protein [Hyella patelloides LEGE 07179]